MMSGQLSIRFVGGAFFRSSDDDDGGYQGKGASMQLGLLLRFRTGTTRIGVAVRLLNLDVLWLETRSGVWRPGPGGGQAWTCASLTAIKLDVGGLVLTF